GIAHDFNNLLTAILGYSELLRDELGPRDQKRMYADEIHKAGDRAASLVQQLLGFSRKQMIAPRVIDLNVALADSRRLLERVIGEDVRLDLIESEYPVHTLIDPVQVDQVLVNLVVNARDAMPEGGLLKVETASVMLDEAYVRMHADARAGPHAMLAVTDTGVGMPPEVRERIFDPFFTTKEVGQGTGLGLSTVYGIVQQHGGSIQCYSEPNIGTTFKVYLPLAGGAQAAAAEESVFEMGIMGEETVLLADDEASVRDLAARVLQDAGYTVLCAADGVEAMSLVREHGGRIDLILTDVVMPKVNGPAMAREARSRYPGVKLLFMSGYAGNPVERMGQNMVGVPILRKPFTARKL
ncbi:MAG: response regulator, partial [Candidatus Eisenbacteria sp.]|nr:response regulator [Candidatus Eisenbacteria bacterium]